MDDSTGRILYTLLGLQEADTASVLIWLDYVPYRRQQGSSDYGLAFPLDKVS